MAEMYGKVDGCSRGRGGSMHLFDAATRFYRRQRHRRRAGFRSPSASRWPTRCAASDRVTACFFGDGAVAEGEFHEAINLAALWKLPVLFCCENNLYAMGTAIERAQSQTDLALKAASYGMPAVAGRRHGRAWRSRRPPDARLKPIRAGGGPHFLELRTYRFRAHSMFDPELYRDKAEVERVEGARPDRDVHRAARAAEAISRRRPGGAGSARSRTRSTQRSRSPRRATGSRSRS